MTISESEPVVPRALIERIKAILLKPAQEWDVIDAEPATVQSLYKGYLIYIAAIGPICMLIGEVVFLGFPVVGALVQAIVTYVMWLVMAFVFALVIEALAPTFDGEKNRIQALKLAVYSMTASAVASVFSIYPPLSALAILGLYGIYILWLGLPKLMKAPEAKRLGYFGAVIGAMLLLGIVVGAVMGPLMVLGAVHHASFY